jgi:hypothetical protein
MRVPHALKQAPEGRKGETPAESTSPSLSPPTVDLGAMPAILRWIVLRQRTRRPGAFYIVLLLFHSDLMIMPQPAGLGGHAH